MPYPVSLNTATFVYLFEYSFNYTTFWKLFYHHQAYFTQNDKLQMHLC